MVKLDIERMDFEHALHIFNTLYQDVNGYFLSTKGRAEFGSEDKAFTYGEVSPEAFYSILNNLPDKPTGTFYDLGSGTGKAVLLAYLLFNFSKIVGVELLKPLHTTAEHVLGRFQKEFKELVPENKEVEFVLGDFLQQDLSDGDVVFMHSTCFPESTWKKLSPQLEKLKEGSYVLTVTKTAEVTYLEHLKSKEYGMAWGRATVHFYRKC